VLLAEGSVTVAAERLNLSVPATSRTLARVRVAFDDPILVRAGRGLVPTPRALALQGRLHRLVEEAHALVEMGRALDLAALERTFTIRANDSLISLVAAPLVGQVQRDAPGVRLRFVPEGLEDLAPLRNGAVDIDFGVIHGFGPEVRTEELYREHLVGLVAADHRLATGRGHPPSPGRSRPCQRVPAGQRPGHSRRRPRRARPGPPGRRRGAQLPERSGHGPHLRPGRTVPLPLCRSGGGSQRCPHLPHPGRATRSDHLPGLAPSLRHRSGPSLAPGPTPPGHGQA
jgi:DNA-binding transcriptional LysR family regulator